MSRPLFVYGTLQRGFPNPWARRLWLGGAPGVTAARVAGRLYSLGSYPGLLLPDGPDQWVYGELVEPRELLEELDAYEGPEYDRRLLEAFTHDRVLMAWVYVYTGPIDESQRIPSGRFTQTA